MKNWTKPIILGLTIICVVAVGWFLLSALQADRTVAVETMVVKLVNQAFNAPFVEQDDVGEITVAHGWAAWWYEGDQVHRPEYKPETSGQGSSRVRTLTTAQKQFTTFSRQFGGVQQKVVVEPGAWYEFSCWAYVWSSNKDDPDRSEQPGKLAAFVGINPWGDARAARRTTVWGKESVGDDGLLAYNQWVHLFVTAQAWSENIIVFAGAEAVFPVKHNDVYFDDCMIQSVDITAPFPTPDILPTPISGEYPSLEDIRGVVREELDQTRLGQ